MNYFITARTIRMCVLLLERAVEKPELLAKAIAGLSELADALTELAGALTERT